jgi:hypothetical protein
MSALCGWVVRCGGSRFYIISFGFGELQNKDNGSIFNFGNVSLLCYPVHHSFGKLVLGFFALPPYLSC